MKLNQKDRFKLAIEILVEEIHIRKKRNFFPPSIIIHPFFDLIPFEGKSGEFERNGIIFLIHSYFHLPRHVFSIFLSSFVSLISERNISLDRVARDRYNCEWDYTLVRILFNAFTLRSSFRALLRDGYAYRYEEERERERGVEFYRITTRSSIIIVAKDWLCRVTTPYSTSIYFLLSNVRIANAFGI